jgi:hypothetical protein
MNKLKNTGYTKEITKVEDAVMDYVGNYMNTDNPHLK